MPSSPASARPDAERIQVELYRRMRPAQRLAAALELNRALDALSLAGIRSRHGALPASEARLRLFARRLGRETMLRAFAWDPGPHGDG